MSPRKVICIDEARCNGCGACIPNCPEGALHVIGGKARLVGELLCDGLGACLGQCPAGALSVEEREAEPYDERRVLENMLAQGQEVVQAHLAHLRKHGADDWYTLALGILSEKGIDLQTDPAVTPVPGRGSGCPGSQPVTLNRVSPVTGGAAYMPGRLTSQLKTWPVQLHLVSSANPALVESDLLIAADCVGFASPNFHSDYLKNRVLLIGCPKLDDRGAYWRKLTAIFSKARIRSVLVLHMEVPCCFGLVTLVRDAIARSGQTIPLAEQKITLAGEPITPVTDPVSGQ